MELSEIIIKKIKDEGPVSFHDFMELALDHQELGYYTSCSEKFRNNRRVNLKCSFSKKKSKLNQCEECSLPTLLPE